MTRNDSAAHLNVIWAALEAYREDLIPERHSEHDEIWDEICTAMSWIAEDLGVTEQGGTK